MKTLFAMCALVTPLFVSTAFAQTPASAPKAPTAQQEKMTACNAQATDKKGDERKAFMKDCLSSKPAAASNPQNEKMKACNKDASGKKGEERKTFMKECLAA